MEKSSGLTTGTPLPTKIPRVNMKQRNTTKLSAYKISLFLLRSKRYPLPSQKERGCSSISVFTTTSFGRFISTFLHFLRRPDPEKHECASDNFFYRQRQAKPRFGQFGILAQDAVVMVVAVKKGHQLVQIICNIVRLEGSHAFANDLRIFPEQLDYFKFLPDLQEVESLIAYRAPIKFNSPVPRHFKDAAKARVG